MIQCYHNLDLYHKEGKLISHKMKDKLFTKDKCPFLYVDDGVLSLLSRTVFY